MVSIIPKDESNAKEKIEQFKKEGLHYNLVANEIYRVRSQVRNPFDKSYLPYIIAGLAAFDMGRMMGLRKYSFDNGCFAARLLSKLQTVKDMLEPLLTFDLTSIHLQEHRGEIIKTYETLSKDGVGALHQDQTKFFHVGASKIMHFLHPELFIIVDSNAARAFKAAHEVPFKNTTQPGYSGQKYLDCMNFARIDISEFGGDRFKALEPGTPITRIYDKLAFVTALQNPHQEQ